MPVNISCRLIVSLVVLLLLNGASTPASEPAAAAPTLGGGTQQFEDYFKMETARVSDASLSNIHTLSDWQAHRPELRREAAEMLGLYPLPERTPLHPVVTGKLEEADFTVEKLYFQSRPGLYVTANLYLPKPLTNPAPAVLYLCGHVPVVSNGISYGNKTAYQHHGIWFARHGYVCLLIDTLQYGEILGHHRGTYDENQWWWNSRGYTPAGVETWNAMRALDYLASLPEVDPQRLGVTGRSGGGAYSWFLAALDDRVKVIAPVAGITDLQNYVVNGTVEEHCDCMFLVNTYRWDYPLLAALCAPRPLLLVNSDSDELFPLDGVMRTHNFIKQIYGLYHATTNFGLAMGPGPHKDTPEMQVPVFHWFNVHLKPNDPALPLETAGPKLFPPQDLKVFDQIPADQINTTIQDSFVPAAPVPAVPTTPAAWRKLQETWKNNLRSKCFASWPADAGSMQMDQLFSEEAGGIQYEAYSLRSQQNVELPIYVMRKAGDNPPIRLVLRVADSTSRNQRLRADRVNIQQVENAFGAGKPMAQLLDTIEKQNVSFAMFYPRGTGPTACTNAAQLTTLRRKFMLLGQTLDGMRVWDICRSVDALRSLKVFQSTSLKLEARADMGVNTLYASLFTPGIESLRLLQMPASQKNGPDYLNVLKVLDIPQAAAMAAEHCRLHLQPNHTNGWTFLNQLESSPVANLKVDWLPPKK